MGLRRPARRRLERPDHRLHAARGITPFAAKERPVNDRTPNNAPAAKPASRTDAPLCVGVLVLLVIAAVVIIISFQRSFPTPQADKQRSYDPQPAVGYSGSEETAGAISPAWASGVTTAWEHCGHGAALLRCVPVVPVADLLIIDRLVVDTTTGALSLVPWKDAHALTAVGDTVVDCDGDEACSGWTLEAS
ncbi:hypothetical protein [uncultured Actinomyces sp.]|uniref:hypothetical protein n=1 Tax=uncultured Actinomyces sp. TaxID=249061 RepID=UPI0028EBDA63|nr:hypothetical protein [uncultured Actinomyces sp.]